jgi:hypothetical protein
MKASSFLLAPIVALTVCRLAAANDAGAPEGGASDAGSVDPIAWDGGAVAIAGTACVKGVDAFALVNGSDFSVVFSNLGVALDGASDLLTDRRTCTVRMPGRIEAGTFVTSITQRYQYGARTSVGGSGALTTAIQLFGFAVPSLPLSFPQGTSVDLANEIENRTDTFKSTSPWFANWCKRTRPVTGNFNVNFAVSGERATAADVAVLFVDGLGLRYDVQVATAPCNL